MRNVGFGIKNFEKNKANPFKYEAFRSTANSLVIQIQKINLLKVLALSRTSLKLLTYFINYQDHNSEIFHFDVNHCKRFTEFKDKRSIYNALTELLGKNIIARTENENFYYLDISSITTGEQTNRHNFGN